MNLKIAVKMNLRIITKNHVADPEIGLLTISISKPYGHATPMPPAWELTKSAKFSTNNFLSSNLCLRPIKITIITLVLIT